MHIIPRLSAFNLTMVRLLFQVAIFLITGVMDQRKSRACAAPPPAAGRIGLHLLTFREREKMFFCMGNLDASRFPLATLLQPLSGTGFFAKPPGGCRGASRLPRVENSRISPFKSTEVQANSACRGGTGPRRPRIFTDPLPRESARSAKNSFSPHPLRS